MHVGPAALDLYKGLIHPPGPIAHTQVRPDPFLQVGGIGLKPPKNGGVVDRDAMVLQHEFGITVADREHQVPSDLPQDHLCREVPSLETPAPTHCRALSRTPDAPMLPSRLLVPKLCNRAHRVPCLGQCFLRYGTGNLGGRRKISNVTGAPAPVPADSEGAAPATGHMASCMSCMLMVRWRCCHQPARVA
ncbi:MAG: hypothetical protein JWQ55_4830 [Rhodopila sp.]|jgi:hypothetical protein|nr:hypothetical protein [Rhodopila sp.]